MTSRSATASALLYEPHPNNYSKDGVVSVYYSTFVYQSNFVVASEKFIFDSKCLQISVSPQKLLSLKKNATEKLVHYDRKA